jgi:predicted nucleic acid-binding protein
VEVSRLLLDTTAYSAMRRGDRRLLEPLQEASEIFLTSVVVGELVYGFIGGRLEGQNRRLLRDFLESDRVRVASVDEETAERYAAIRDYLRRKGTPIPTNDLWIAASAAQHGLKLLCLDRHFKEVPQILLEYFEPMA